MAAVVFESIEASPGRKTWRRLLRRGGALFGLAVVLFFIAMALLYHINVFKSSMPRTKLTFDDLTNMGK